MKLLALFPALLVPLLASCADTTPSGPRGEVGGMALATGEPAGGETHPIAGRVDLPPQQPRR